MSKITTVQQHILDEERLYPGATGDFTALLTSLTLAAKIISREVNQAGLVRILGETGEINVHGEAVQKLDEFAQTDDLSGHGTQRPPLRHGVGRIRRTSFRFRTAANAGVRPDVRSARRLLQHRRERQHRHDLFDSSQDHDTARPTALSKTACRRGTDQLAAGYFIYGSSTMMVYTTGHGVHGFTLDPSLGEFLLSHENIRTPERGKIYSINEGNINQWDAGTRRYIEYVKQDHKADGRPYSPAIHRIARRGLPSESAEGRHLSLPGPEGKAAVAL